jgi:hypothetical protein
MACNKKCFISSVLQFFFSMWIRKVQGNQKSETEGACQLLIYNDDVNLMGTYLNTTEKNTHATKEVSLKTNRKIKEVHVSITLHGITYSLFIIILPYL